MIKYTISDLTSNESLQILVIETGWQKQGHTWHIVPWNYSSKVGLIDLIMEYIREKMRKIEGKRKNQKD